MLRLVFAVVLLILAYCSAPAQSAYCSGHPHADAHHNLLDFYTQDPVFVKAVPNGKLFTVGQGPDVIKVIHVYGNAYQMGYAHGLLLKEDLQVFFPILWNYLLKQVEDAIKFLPSWLQHFIAENGIDAALDLTYDLTRGYTNPNVFDEMQGIADAAGIDYYRLRRVHMIGELTKGHCSMFGAWGSSTLGGSTIQLRAFDWDENGPYKDYPVITVYHPVNDGHAWANVGFAGWIGVFSGMSSEAMAISEIGVTYPDNTFGAESRIGVPFTFLLRDILQYDKTLDDSIVRIETSRRTCNLILGVGDGKLGTFRGFQYGHSVAYVMDDMNMKPVNDTWHPKIRDVVYFGMDWLCPPFSQRLAEQLNMYHGNITAELAARYIVPMTTTGNLQVCVYDLTARVMYVAYARKDGVTTGERYAYNRPYIRLNMDKLFAEPAPTSLEALE